MKRHLLLVAGASVALLTWSPPFAEPTGPVLRPPATPPAAVSAREAAIGRELKSLHDRLHTEQGAQLKKLDQDHKAKVGALHKQLEEEAKAEEAATQQAVQQWKSSLRGKKNMQPQEMQAEVDRLQGEVKKLEMQLGGHGSALIKKYSEKFKAVEAESEGERVKLEKAFQADVKRHHLEFSKKHPELRNPQLQRELGGN